MTRRTSVRTLLAAVIAIVAFSPPAAAQRGCRVPPGYAVVIGAAPLEVEPGRARTLDLGSSPGPYAPPEPLPRACRVRWFVDAGAPARIDARGRLAVAAAARPGAEFMVGAVVAGDTARQRVYVVDPRLNPIAASWRQAQPGECAPEPVRELVFRRNGRFSVTFVPFETYNDYWGRYSYDPATGALRMTVEHGNNVPPGVDLEGIARVAGSGLVLEGMWLGQPRQEQRPAQPHACTYHFAR